MIRIPQPPDELPAKPSAVRVSGTNALDEPPSTQSNDQDAAPLLVAKVMTNATIRQGSPFADDAATVTAKSSISGKKTLPLDLAEAGPLRYTAVGALFACGLVLGFAIPAAIWFPIGGVIITVVGIALAIFGIQSGYTKVSLGLLLIQLILFLYCFGET